MTEQEQQLLAGLAERIRNAPAPQIDRDADDLIRRTVGSRSDALYILTQTVLIQEMALNQAKAQIEQLKQQSARPQPQGSFLHGPPSSYPASPESNYASNYAPPPPPGGGFSNFLRSAATTAAGVIAGEIAFDSIASIFGHGGGFFGGGGGGVSPGSETIINNYYDDRQSGGGDMGSDTSDVSDADDSSVDDGLSFDDSGSSDV